MTRLRPSLDDVTYADLVAAARARIPGLAPGWTDHNAGDPGIVLVELFAWLSEMLVYQADQLPAERTDAFLRLLNGPDWSRTGDLDAVATTLAALRSPWRAATAADIVHLLTRVWPDDAAADPPGGRGVRRVLCIPGRDLTVAGGRDDGAPGHLSVVVVPAPGDDDGLPTAPAELCAALEDWLEPRRLLGVRHHVVGPRYAEVTVTARIVLRADYAPASVASSGVLTDAAIAEAAGRQAAAAVAAHLSPLNGGAEGTGWPFGRAVHASEIYGLLDRLPGVDFADGLAFPGAAPERAIVVDGEQVGVRLAPEELVSVTVVDSDGRPGRVTVALGGRGGGLP
jgi:hypothetical protein